MSAIENAVCALKTAQETLRKVCSDWQRQAEIDQGNALAVEFELAEIRKELERENHDRIAHQARANKAEANLTTTQAAMEKQLAEVRFNLFEARQQLFDAECDKNRLAVEAMTECEGKLLEQAETTKAWAESDGYKTKLTILTKAATLAFIKEPGCTTYLEMMKLGRVLRELKDKP